MRVLEEIANEIPSAILGSFLERWPIHLTAGIDHDFVTLGQGSFA
jgi:hypothetical protein